MHRDGGDQLLGVGHGVVIGVQIGQMLEVVGVQLLVGQGGIGQRILGEFDDLERIAELGQIVRDQLQHLAVRRGRSADDDGGFVVRQGQGEGGKHEQRGDQQGNEFFHGEPSFIK